MIDSFTSSFVSQNVVSTALRPQPLKREFHLTFMRISLVIEVAENMERKQYFLSSPGLLNFRIF
jgi:hypothetical protein